MRPPPDFDDAIAYLELDPDFLPALQRKWNAGAMIHADTGTDEDLSRHPFDYGAAMAAEALDIINYYLDAKRLGLAPADSPIEQSAYKAADVLDCCGCGPAMAAADAALLRATQHAAQRAETHKPPFSASHNEAFDVVVPIP